MNDLSNWVPKTKLGKMVQSGEIKRIDEILDKKMIIREPEIVDSLVSDLEMDLFLVGQSRGKFGGGKRRAFRQTQKITGEGQKIKFTCVAVVGNKNGYVGVGRGSSNETVPAKEKAIRDAKINLIKIKRGCGSWECWCGSPHSIPFKVDGKVGSTKIILRPAPKGLDLCVADECKKMLRLAGINDVWSKTFGQTDTRINLVFACFNALKKLSVFKVKPSFVKNAGIKEGSIGD